jgi:hypothetical protein
MSNPHVDVPTYAFQPSPPLVRESLTQTTVTNYSHANQLTTIMRRPTYRFTLNMWPLTHVQLNSLTSIHARHQEDQPFYWNGGEFGRVENYNLVGFGTGNERTIFLPNRFMHPSSFTLATRFQNVMSLWGVSCVGGYALRASDGVVFFNSDQIPRSGHDILAKYGCMYRLTFEDFRARELAAGVFAVEMTLIEDTLIG